MFWQKKKPEEWPWEWASSWIELTEDTFNAGYKRRQSEFWVAEERGTADQRPREAWEEVRAMYKIRERLMQKGWLPPRKKDILEKTGPEKGSTLAGMPKKWSFDRKYEKEELPYSVQDYYPDEMDKAKGG